MPEQRAWSRRTFLKVAAASGAAALLPRGGRILAQASTTDVLRVGFLSPRTGPWAEAGEAAARGAELGAAEAAHLAELLGKKFELVTADAADAEVARREGLRWAESGEVLALAGGVDEPSCLALSEVATHREIVFFNIGCASHALRGTACGRYAFHVEASVGMYADALAEWLVRKGGLRRWHFVSADGEDGAAASRRARRALEARGGEEVGDLRIAAGGLARADALAALRKTTPDVVLVALEGEARADFLRRYRQAELPFELATLFPSDLPVWETAEETRIGIQPVLWHPRLFRYGAEQLGDRFSDRFGRPLDSCGWAAWMAVKILGEAALRAGGVGGPPLVRFLERRGTQFDGHKGKSLTFRPWDHQLRQPVYLIRAKPGAKEPRESFEHVAELPLGRRRRLGSSSTGSATARTRRRAGSRKPENPPRQLPTTGNLRGRAMVRTQCLCPAWAAVLALALAPAGLWAQAAPLAYVSNEHSGNILVLNTANDREIATIPIGEGRPRGVQVSPDGKTIYVAVSDDDPFQVGDDDAIVVIDARTRKVRDRLPGGTDPEQFVVSPDGTRLYVANEDAGTASIIDLRTKKVITTLTVGIEPEGVAISPDGRWVYVTAETSNTVSVIDTELGRVVASFLVDVRPRAVAFSPDGKRAYVTAEIGGTLSVVDVATHEVIDAIELERGEAKPVGVAISPDGRRVYVANGHADTVSGIDAETHEVFASIRVGKRPWGIAITPDGKKIYTANGVSHDVSVIDAGTHKVVATVKAGRGAWGVAIGP